MTLGPDATRELIASIWDEPEPDDWLDRWIEQNVHRPTFKRSRVWLCDLEPEPDGYAGTWRMVRGVWRAA